MPWVVGIDEAGYGPNLGPFVQAAVAIRLPGDDIAGWDHLAERVRRTNDTATTERVLIDDSKKVYAGSNGLARLLSNLPVLTPTLTGILSDHGLPGSFREAEGEPWYTVSPPVAADATVIGRFADVLGPRMVNVVMPRRFNAIIERTGSKAAVTSRGAIALMQATLAEIVDDAAITFVLDKQGGRNFYAPLLQDAFPTGWVIADVEGAALSRYRVMNLDRDVRAVVMPKADTACLAVAWASMLAKSVRELSMAPFNAYWARHVPGLVPTAGYPVDAKRFIAEIDAARAALGIDIDAVWRRK
jgi:ribonuclease HII